MPRLTIFSPSEQVAAHLRDELRRGSLTGEMPGTPQLSLDLGVDRKTIITALDQLELEGLLVAQGNGRRRRIVLPEAGVEVKASPLRVAILLYEKDDRKEYYLVDLLHQLQEQGFPAFFGSRTLSDLKMDVRKVAKLVKESDADAWVVAGGSREVLEWFAGQVAPAFALFGRLMRVRIAGTGPLKSPAIAAAVQRLVDFGHRRIVMLAHEERRKPNPGLSERSFLAALESHGIQPGPYNLPDWDESRAGFHRMLDALFHHSPPTALLVDTVALFTAAKDHLARRGIQAPEQVSLICTDSDPAFAWYEPAITHVHWDPSPCIRRVVSWVDNVARGKEDRRQSFTKAELVEGGTTGPVAGR